MLFDDVRDQISHVVNRAIETGISVHQNFPKINIERRSIGDLGATSSLKNIAYTSVYKDLSENNQYHLKLPDGGFMVFQYQFNTENLLKKHRLAFFPSPILPTVEEAPELYNHDQLYGDIILDRIVRFPIRFDYDPENYEQRYHAHSHLTLGQFDNCRIPVSSAVEPNIFFLFILRNFYFQLYRKHQNKLEKKIASCRANRCITSHELIYPHLFV